MIDKTKILFTLTDVLNSGVLNEPLVIIPQKGATNEQIVKEEAKLIRPLSEQHKLLLKKWNGLYLDIINFYGCRPVENNIGVLSEHQLVSPRFPSDPIIIGFCPAEFLYLEDKHGAIFSYDTDGGQVEELAKDLDSFITHYIFGDHADQFAGDAWKQELISAGILRTSR